MITIISIFNYKAKILLSISSIEINNLTNFVISVIPKRKINQKVISKHQRKTNVRMRKSRIKRIIVVLNVINQVISIEIAQITITKTKQQ